MPKPLFSNPLAVSHQTKQILFVSGIVIVGIAAYEFSANAGTAAGEGIGQGLGNGLTDLLILGGVALVIFTLV